ncbi:MAG TPA: PKD domain-containing protein [Cyclobacteriaceae bacterium]
MKKIIYNILCIVALQVCLVSCSEDNEQLGAPPVAADATFTYAPSAANKNIINFTSTTEAFLKTWDFGNGVKASGDNVTGTYPVKGSYVVKMTAYTSGGSIVSSQTIEIEQTDPTLLDIPVYNLLTGGNSKPEGKTWVVDATVKGHFGLGPDTSNGPDWYQAGPNEKDGSGLYNDKYTFKINAFSYVFDTEGDVFINNKQAANFPGSYPNAGDDTAPFTAPTDLTWNISGDNNQILTISNGGFIGYYTGVSTYEILKLEENEMYLRYLDAANAGFAWYLHLIPEGFTHTPPPAPEYKIADIYENFDGSSNVTFIDNSNGSIVTYDNPATLPINTSLKVGKYTKANGAGGEYANVQIKPGYKMDLHNRNVFKMKVFIPGFNDYTTDNGSESWQSYHTLQKQISVKLQNGDLGANGYTTQYEVIQKNLDTDKWIELTFDFSAVADREDLDKIVIQFGGEAIFTDGIFYLDDFELLP